MAATWDTDLVHRMGETISTEARAKYNQAMRDDHHESILRAHLLGAEHQHLSRSALGTRTGNLRRRSVPHRPHGRGLRHRHAGRRSRSTSSVVSTPKHYAVHSGPEPMRHQFNVDASPHDLEDTYLPAFRAAVTEAHAQSVMCAYNAIDGAPACANTMLLRDHLRDAWHFDGYVVSDCAAVADVFTGHQLRAGHGPRCCRRREGRHRSRVRLSARVRPSRRWWTPCKQGLITEAEIDTALHRLFRARFRLGMFDPPSSFAYGQHSDQRRSIRPSTGSSRCRRRANPWCC